MDELKDIIAHCESRGGLNLSDISRWLDAQVQTVHQWARGRQPHKYKRDHIMKRMNKLLEVVNSKPPGQPVIPIELKQPQRASYIEELRNEHFGILQEDTTQ